MQDVIPPPRIVILPLLYACNCRCVMCNIWRHEGSVRWKPDALDQIFRHDLFSQNVEVVNVTGGEPSLHDDAVNILELIVNRLISLDTISLQTNGLSMERVLSVIQSAIQLLLKQEGKGRTIHLDVNISLDGPEEIHDKIRGVKGAWKSAVETARNSRALISPLKRGAVSFNFTIVRQNVAYIRKMFEYSREVGIETTYTFPQETDMFMNNRKTTHTFAIDERQRQELISILKELSGSINGRSAISRRYFMTLINLLNRGTRKSPCPLAKSGVFLDPGGDIYPCWNASRHRMGNIFTQEPETILARRAERAYEAELNESCRSCTSNCYSEWNRKRFAKLAKSVKENTQVTADVMKDSSHQYGANGLPIMGNAPIESIVNANGRYNPPP